ncbi:hypothetical protein CAJAP_00668 [Camponotus japonicus]
MVPTVTSPPARKTSGLCRGRPGPEPAGWIGAVVPSPPLDGATPDVESSLTEISVVCYRRTSTRKQRNSQPPSVFP